MNDHKELEKQLKGPDLFQTKVAEIIDLLIKNKNAVVLVIGLGALVAALGFGQRFWMDWREEGRREEFAKIEAVYNDELEVVSKERETLSKSLEDLKNKKRGTASPAAQDPKANGKTETKPAMDEKALAEDPEVKALQAKIDNLEPDHGKSAVQFKGFYDKHTSQPEGWVAGMRYAGWLVRQGKQAEARGILEQILKASDSEKYGYFQSQGRFMLIAVLEDLGDWDAAVKEVDLLDKKAPTSLKPRTLLTRAEIMIHKKDKENALKAIETLIKDHAETAEADRARSLKVLVR